MIQKLLFLVIGCTLAGGVSAQTFSASGTVTNGKSSLVGVTVLVNDQSDSTKRNGVITNTEGRFLFPALSSGTYRLRATFIGYQTLEMQFRVDSQTVNLGALRLIENARQLKGVTIIGQQLRVEQKGDTVQYNAGAFKTNPDATAEDLIKKLPGVTLENGTVKTQGEDVKRVLIDGKPFFGDDPTLALRNLPAEVIDRIQVFDRLSDQAQFTGFDDGNTDKTINIITKPGRNNGQFGKVYAGFGNDRSDDPARYTLGGTVNFFKGDRRISVLGLSNNINQQNFSSQDLLGALGGTQRQGGGANRPRGGGGGATRGGSGDASNFLVGQQGGITGTSAFGLNYSDTWGKKVTVTGSYFFNDTRNTSNTLLNRTYFATSGQSQFYSEDETAATRNNNNRTNLRLEYKINSKNSLIITPQMSWQSTRSTNAFTGVNTLSQNVLLSRTASENNTRSQGYNFSNNAVFQHRFAKQGRTFSVGLTTSFNDRTRDNRLQSTNEFFTGKDSILLIDQQANTLTGGNTLSGNISYTEPLSARGQLQLTYSPGLTNGNTDKETFNLIGTNGSQIRRLDTTLSNTFNSRYLSQRAGASYRLRGKSWQFSAGLFYQNASLTGDQTFPRPFEVRKTFSNLLPTAMFNFRPTPQQNLRLMYRTATNVPSVNQLQNVIDNSNPLQLTAGNPDLKQEYTHTFSARYNRTNPANARSFFLLLSGTLTNDNITNTTFLASRDTLLASRSDRPGVMLYRGSQLTRPVNLNGYRNMRSFATYGLPVAFLKSNLNLNLGYTYTHAPGLINGVLNLSNSSVFNSGFVLSSSASETFDFTVSYSANYNLVRNTIRPQLNTNYFFHTGNVRLNWLFGKGFLLNSDLTNTLYQGLGAGFDQNFVLWNLSFGKKMLKNKLAEIKLTVFDVLRQNNSISRNVTETYVDDTRTQVLGQYAMLTFAYTFRNFIR